MFHRGTGRETAAPFRHTRRAVRHTGAWCPVASSPGWSPRPFWHSRRRPALPIPCPRPPWPAGLAGTLVFESDVAGRPGLYTLDLAHGRAARLTGAAEYRDQTPRWSPDGRRVLFSSNRAHDVGAAPDRGTPDFDLWSVDADGRDARRITSAPANEQDPAWTSP